MNEYRWEFSHIGQGHYILASDMDDAIQMAVAEAREINLGNHITIQKFKPTKGPKKTIYFDKRPSEFIGTVRGQAKYVKTEIEDEYGRWNQSYAIRDGYWVIHEGRRHHIYKEVKK